MNKANWTMATDTAYLLAAEKAAYLGCLKVLTEQVIKRAKRIMPCESSSLTQTLRIRLDSNLD